MKQHALGRAANPGLVRPPLVFASALAFGVLINLVYPWGLALGYGGKIAACVFLFAGTALFIWTRSTFKDAGTAISGNKPATRLLQSGPFRFSRNPMYVAFTLLYASAAFWLANLWVFATLMMALRVIHAVVIRREERFMTARFGAEYSAYVSRTRRWI